MKHSVIISIFCLCAVLLCACGNPEADQKLTAELTVQPPPTVTAPTVTAPPVKMTPTPQPTPIKTTQPDVPLQETEQTPIPTTAADTAEHGPGTVLVQPGDTLASDIIPRISDVFSISENEVENVLEDCRQSKLINKELSDFRRMEGIILPGKYTVAANESLTQYVNMWIEQAEDRYDALVQESSGMNDLEPYEQLSLAAVIEWECLPNDYYDEVAAVFLNRLDNGSKLRSCVTTEYALSYQRPYLTNKDTDIQSLYNTNVVRGVPIGPICVIEDDCLRAAIGKKTDNKVYYFFNDYALHEILFFSDYDEFKQAAAVSRQLYDQTFDIDPYAKVNKKQVFGYAQ